MILEADRPQALIITSSHWEGDARLNRHLRYLREADIPAGLISTATRPKSRALASALRYIVRTDAAVVMLPDPELFVLGTVLARLLGKKPLLDIHEDYSKTAAERSWIPDRLRPLVALIARISTIVGRRVAWRVVVAADHLAEPGDRIVPNLPDPSELHPVDGRPKKELVYVGEVTTARGALDMVDLLSHLSEEYTLVVVGRADEGTRLAMEKRADTAGVGGRLQVMGRRPHDEAWERATQCLAGLALFQPVPAYVEATATKIWEYMAADLPPVVSDLPGQAAIVSRLSPDLVCASLEEAAAVISRLADDEPFREDLVARGRALAVEEWNRARPDLAIQEAVRP